MQPKLDAADRRILQVLCSNARESTSGIARKSRLRRENVDYRLKRLLRLGIVKGFMTEFDEEALGIRHHVMFLQLVRLGPGAEKSILKYLNGSPHISWIGTAAGKWSLVFDVYLPGGESLQKLIDEFLSSFGEHVESYVTLELTDGEYYFHKLLGVQPTKKHAAFRGLHRPDHTDLSIMRMLNANARASYASLSSEIGMTANGIKGRIKQLERSGIIRKYSLSLDFRRFGLEWYGIQLRIAKFDGDAAQRVRRFLRDHPAVVFFYRYIGPWDYDLGVTVRSSSELRSFINELRTTLASEVKIVDVFITLEEFKAYSLPEGAFR